MPIYKMDGKRRFAKVSWAINLTDSSGKSKQLIKGVAYGKRSSKGA